MHVEHGASTVGPPRRVHESTQSMIYARRACGASAKRRSQGDHAVTPAAPRTGEVLGYRSTWESIREPLVTPQKKFLRT